MRKIMLNGQWELAEAGNDRLCEVQVPGSVLSGSMVPGRSKILFTGQMRM